ncbi:MAG: cbb3-type cytochrome c oxidase subunit I [Ottowia sp.]
MVNTSYFMYLAVLASMLHGLTVPGAMEVAQRQKGYTKGLFEWLRKAPWGNPTFSGVFISIIGFGFLGGITGVMMGTEQLNLIIHNTIYVPGHFHATVVVGTTLTFMALTYYLIPVLFKREMIAPKLAQWQPYLFGFSMYFFCLVMMGAGTLGVSRRHWDMAFQGAALAYEWPGAAYLMMASGGHRWHGGDCRWRHLHLRHRGFPAVGSQAGRRCQQPEVHAAGACHAHGGGPDRRRGWLHRPRHLRAGAGVPGRLRALLLHQLEVPLDPVGPELMVARDPRPA